MRARTVRLAAISCLKSSSVLYICRLFLCIGSGLCFLCYLYRGYIELGQVHVYMGLDGVGFPGVLCTFFTA